MSNMVLNEVTHNPQNSASMIPGIKNSGAVAQGQSSVDRPMTVNDVILRTLGLLSVIVVVGLMSAGLVLYSGVSAVMLMLVGGVGALAVIIVAAITKKFNSPVVAVVYSVLEGMFLGAGTLLIASVLSGFLGAIAVMSSIAATVGILFLMLTLYTTGIIKVTKTFTNVVIFSTLGIFVVSLVGFVLSMFGIGDGLRSATPLGMLFSIVCIVVASLNFCLDFKQIDSLVQSRADKKNAWGASLGLIVTLVWLYIEILRLITNVFSVSR